MAFVTPAQLTQLARQYHNGVARDNKAYLNSWWTVFSPEVDRLLRTAAEKGLMRIELCLTRDLQVPTHCVPEVKDLLMKRLIDRGYSVLGEGRKLTVLW